MSRARHHHHVKHHAHGGPAHGGHMSAGGERQVGNPSVFKLASEHSAGHIEGGKAKSRGDRKGADAHPYSSAKLKHGGKAHHGKHGHSLHHGVHGKHHGGRD